MALRVWQWWVREENASEGGTNIWGRGNELPDTFWDRRWIWVGRAYFGHLHFIAQMELVVGLVPDNTFCRYL